MSQAADSETFFDPDASREYLRSWQDRIGAMATRTQDRATQLGQLRITGKDSNNLVEVTIDSSGGLLGLEFSDRIQRYTPDVMSRAVMEAMRKARTTAADRAREIAVDTMGPGSLSARTIADRMQQQLRRPDDGDDLLEQRRQ